MAAWLSRSWLNLAVGVVAGAALLPSCTLSQTSDQPYPFAKDAPYQLVIDQLSADVEFYDSRNKILARWPAGSRAGRTTLAEVPHSRSLQVRLVNANPLLYRYEITSTPAARGGIKSCIGIGERLASSGALASLAMMPGQSQPNLVSRETFVPASPPSRGEESGLISRESMEAVAAQLKSQAKEYIASMSRIRTVSAMIDDSLATIAELGESLPVATLLEGLEKTIARSIPGVHSAQDVQLVVRQRLGTETIVSTTGYYADAIRAGRYDGDSTDAIALEILGLASQLNQVMRESIPMARLLQNQIARIEAAKENATQDFILDPSSDYRRIVIQAIPTSDFAEIPRLRAGKKELFSKPVSSFICEVSVGMAFMNAPPKYAIDNGVLVDRDASDERTAPQFLAHAGLNRVPWVAALGGIGFGGQARPDFYLGGTVRALSPILFNFGAIWQRMDRLPAGMEIGKPVSDASLLTDLPRRYKAGFFWGFSFGR